MARIIELRFKSGWAVPIEMVLRAIEEAVGEKLVDVRLYENAFKETAGTAKTRSGKTVRFGYCPIDNTWRAVVSEDP